MNLASVSVRLGGCVLALGAAALLAACQPGSSAATLTPGSGSSGLGGATATVEPPTSFGPLPSPSPDDAAPVVLDPTLLAVLPESIEGFPITEAPDEAALAITDPVLPKLATALDAGVAVDTGGGNLVYALVVKLRADTLTDDSYRQWRDSFDQGACTAAGGVAGHAEATIDGRQVFITSCVGGLRTYHVWLKEQDLLISASSIGEGRFGEKLMDNLRESA